MSRTLWSIPHYFTSYNIKVLMSYNIKAIDIYWKNAYWKHKNNFFSLNIFLKLKSRLRLGYWNQCYWLVSTFSNLAMQSKILYKINKFFIKSSKCTHIICPFKVTKRKNYRLMILNLFNSLKLLELVYWQQKGLVLLFL